MEKPPTGTRIERNPTLDQVKEAIKTAFDGNRIALNSGDLRPAEETLAPKLIKEIQDMVASSINWDTFGQEMVNYKKMVSTRDLATMGAGESRYVSRIIDDAVSHAFVRTFIKNNQALKNLSVNS